MQSVVASSNTQENWKADFNAVYDSADPREYFRTLGGLGYIIPDEAKGIFRSLIEGSPERNGKQQKVVDVGSSYGINSAVIRHPVNIDMLSQRYAQPDIRSLSPEELRDLDTHYFASWPRLNDVHFVGVDTSEPAVSYAESVGLLDATVVTNLEESDPSTSEREQLQEADFIISTGCVGYVTERTFRRILDCCEGDRPPVVASFVLRAYPYDAIEDELSRAGLVTEKLEGVTFTQRRFSSTTELESTLSRLDDMGIDPTGKETDGRLHAELFLSRTPEEVSERPITSLFPPELAS